MVPLEKQYGLLASPNAYFKGHKRGVKDLCKKKSVKFSSMRVFVSLALECIILPVPECVHNSEASQTPLVWCFYEGFAMQT